jgi:hypothetical protein
MVKPVSSGPLLDPLLFEDGSTPPKQLTSRRSSTNHHRKLGKHDSVIEQLIAAQPLKAEDIVYPTNMVVQTPSTTPPYKRSYNEKLEELLEALPCQRLAGLVTISVFAGYAALFSMQHVLKVLFGIPDDDSAQSHQFSYAITAMYISNLIFRLGQNVILRPLTPRERSLVGLCLMTSAMLILAVFVIGSGWRSLSLVAAAYALGGAAIGTFETNYSVVLAALGNRTKVTGISGIPIGIFLVIVPGFIAVTAGLPVIYIYWSVVGLIALAAGILWYGLTFPQVDWLLSEEEMEDGGGGLDDVSIQGEEASPKKWIMSVISVGFVFTINMVFVSAFSPGVLLYLYNTRTIGIEKFQVPTGYFFATFSSFGFVADVVSRRRIYGQKPQMLHPIRFLLFTAIGVGIILAKIPVIAPLGTWFVFFANGSIYAQSCRWIDLLGIDKQHLVMANSIFFFMGDCGSVIGAILIPFIRDLMTTYS